MMEIEVFVGSAIKSLLEKSGQTSLRWSLEYFFIRTETWNKYNASLLDSVVGLLGESLYLKSSGK